MVKLGSEVLDVITGFKGIATARTIYLNGCISICVEGFTLGEKDGEPVRRNVWFDEQRVATVKEEGFTAQPSPAEVGGPQVSYAPRDGAR